MRLIVQASLTLNCNSSLFYTLFETLMQINDAALAAATAYCCILPLDFVI